MEQKGIVEKDLKAVFGQEIAAKLLNGQLEIDSDRAKALGDFFNVDSSLFLN